ncbi:MAG: hypothetical protein JNM07_02275 [Phycisphaerae bacterium]|nr:hypothetical protein [Phycisphaerae bacterium]
MDTREIGIVVFDVGGVLIRICRTWAEGCAAAGLPVREPATHPDQVAARRVVHRLYEQGLIACDECFRRLAAATGGVYAPEEVRRIHDAWLLDEYIGVDELVRGLKEARIPVGLLSNSNHAHWSRVAPGGRGEFPTPALADHAHASHLLRLSKPDDRMFRRFEHLSGFSGAQVLYFDDLNDNVEAARARGWRGYRVDPLGDTALQMGRVLGELGMLV